MPKPKYFENFPTKEKNFFGVKQKIRDLNRYVRLSPDVLESKYAFYDYVIKDGQRPDHVAYDVYGDSKYYWIVLIANNIRDIWKEWPMDGKQFQKYIQETYGSVQNAQSTIHHYETTDGLIVDAETAGCFDDSSVECYSVSNYDYEDQQNEQKRKIVILQPRHIADFQEEISNLFEGQ